MRYRGPRRPDVRRFWLRSRRNRSPKKRRKPVPVAAARKRHQTRRPKVRLLRADAWASMASRRRRRLSGASEALVEIAADRGHQRFDFGVEEVVGAGNDLLLDDDAFLRLELLDQSRDVAMRHHRIFVAMDDKAGRRAGRKEGEVVKVRRRRDRDEALDFRPPHQKLHADPGAEGKACNPAGARLGIDRLHPVERRRRVRQFADAVVEAALAAPDAAEVEAQRREAAMHEGIIDLIDDLMVHRAAELRVRMQHNADRRVLLPRRVIAAFDTAGGPCGKNLGHFWEPRSERRFNAVIPACLTTSAAARNYLMALWFFGTGGVRFWRREHWVAASSTRQGPKSKHYDRFAARERAENGPDARGARVPKASWLTRRSERMMPERSYFAWNATGP